MEIYTKSYYPDTATLTAATFVINSRNAEIKASKDALTLANQQVESVLDVMSKAHPDINIDDLRLLVASGAAEGYEGGKLEQLQFIAESYRNKVNKTIRDQVPPVLR